MQEERNVSFNRGRVSEYNGQKDLYCDYITVVTGNNQAVYYLLKDKKLDNDFFIASTDLKEAIDPNIPHAKIGLIDKNGNIAIPFENKSIKQVAKDYLLVVRNQPQSKSVLDAISSRNDPASAEKMVNANAQIKDKLNKEMKYQGKFIMNDLLSEGTICSLKGENLLDNKYYSFIGMTDDAFYCSTNVPEEAVTKVSRNGAFVEEDEMTVPPVVAPATEPVVPDKEVTHNEQPVEEEKVKAPEVPPVDVGNVPSPERAINEAFNLADIFQNHTEESKPEQEAFHHTDASILDDTKEEPKEEVKKGSMLEDLGPVLDLDDYEVPHQETVEKVADSKPLGNPFADEEDEKSEENDMNHVLTAVRDLVKENQELKQHNEELNQQLHASEAKAKEVSDLEEENKKLMVLVDRLRKQNAMMANGLSQMKDFLSIPSSEVETPHKTM